MSITELPSNLLVKIFQNVNSGDLFPLGRSCKMFHRLIFSPDENYKSKEIWAHHNTKHLILTETNRELFDLFNLKPLLINDMICQVKFFVALEKYRFSNNPERYYLFIDQLVRLGNNDWLNLFIKKEKKLVNSQESTKNPLFIACKKNNKKVVTALLELDMIEIHYFQGTTVLGKMLLSKNSEMVKLLLSSKKININDVHAELELCNYTPLEIILLNDDQEMLALILERKDLDINAPIFSESIRFNYIAIDCIENNGMPPLIWAAKNGKVDSVKKLLDSPGVDLKKTWNGRTALELAANNEIRLMIEVKCCLKNQN